MENEIIETLEIESLELVEIDGEICTVIPINNGELIIKDDITQLGSIKIKIHGYPEK